MTLEELHKLFKSDQKSKSEQLKILEKYFPYFDRELRKTGVTKQLLWLEYYAKHPDGFKLSQFRYWYNLKVNINIIFKLLDKGFS
jgi:hypothetical protein